MAPIPACDNQETVFASAFSVIENAVSAHSFPAASIAVTQAGHLIARKAFGTSVYAEDLEGALSRSSRRGGDFDFPIKPETLFDIASLTKPIATTTMAMLLYERGLLELDAPVPGTVPEFLSGDLRRSEVTFRMLLAHSSGLPAYERLFLRFSTRNDLLQAAFATPLTADPGSRAEYSDIGFMILGVALERIAEESMDVFCQREIFGPLGMRNTTFNPPADLRWGIAPTADERTHAPEEGSKTRSTFRNRIIQGEVQDENAFVLGGVAGHAGLFSTAEDVARLAHVLLGGGSPILRPETIALFTRCETTPGGTSRALGWDTPGSPSQSGRYFGSGSFGHLGYTGTSLWIDPDRKLSVTLLTNRTWPDCSNQAIKQVRPKVHDAIVSALHNFS
jgi:CubicO group peptidase (beta-lactamase class C family)